MAICIYHTNIHNVKLLALTHILTLTLTIDHKQQIINIKWQLNT